MKIDQYEIANNVVAAPMAGVTDKPYRQVCRNNGAGMVVSEMITSRADLRHSTKSRFRSDLKGEPEPVVVQIVGTDPQMLSEAAQYNAANGAQIIDINMGCPAKKVCKKAAGSALLSDELLVAKILASVASSVDVPVTVKIRTGPTPETRNAATIAKIAEDSGIAAITVHGRTRECKFVGQIEYDSIAAVKAAVSIPVVANGDICSPAQALEVMNYTGADAVMIGRAAQGQPWLFQQVADHLAGREIQAIPSAVARAEIILEHLQAIHAFYGDVMGVRLARKHIKWYLLHWDFAITENTRQKINATEHCEVQYALIEHFLFSSLARQAA